MIDRESNQRRILGQDYITQSMSDSETDTESAAPTLEELETLDRLTDWLLGEELAPGTARSSMPNQDRLNIEYGRGALAALSPRDIVNAEWFDAMEQEPAPPRTAAEAEDPQVRFAHFRHRVLKHLRSLMLEDENSQP